MDRKERLLMVLESQNDWITGKQLAKILNVTDRTIRSDIDKINLNFEYKVIESDIKKGYRFINQNFKLNLKKISSIPETPSQRYSYIIQKLLFKHHKININELIEEIYISEYSLENDLKKIKEILKEYGNLKVIKRNNYLYLIGDEISKRLFYKNMLLKETQKNFLNMDEIASLYHKFDLIKTKQILESLLNHYHYDISEINFPILMIHIGIAIERMLDFNYIETISVNQDIINTIEYQISNDFFKQLGSLFNLKVTENEIIILSRLLISKKDYHQKNKQLIFQDLKFEQIVKEMLDYIYNQYSINLTLNQDLLIGLSLHLQALFERHKNNSQSRNFYLKEIKKRFPFVFELAILASDFISKLLHIEISEDEIGFIALHLGMAYSQINQKKYRTILIFPKTQAINKIPMQKIENLFSENLEIIAKLSYFEEETIKQLQADLIICSIPLKHRLNILTVYISFFMNYEDESNIRNAIFKLNQKRLEKEYSVFIDNVITKKHFYTKMNFNSHLDALKYMCDNLYQDNIVEANFYQSVIKREKFSPTSFAYGFAIPHALDSSLVYKANISIMLLDKPLIWGEYQVKVIFLLALDKFNNHILNLFFEWITNLYDDINALNKLLECKNYEEFITVLNKK